MRKATCRDHPGRIVETHPCQAKLRDGTICGYSLSESKVDVERETKEAEVAMEAVEATTTETVETGRAAPYETLPECYGQVGTCPDPSCALSKPCADVAATQEDFSTPQLKPPPADFSREAGEWMTGLRQPTLDPDIFPAVDRQDVPMVKIGVTGSVEMTRGEWEAYCDQGLEPGRVVRLELTGYLPNPHAKWVKRSGTENNPFTGRSERYTWWEQEAQVKVKLLELRSFELRGVYDGD